MADLPPPPPGFTLDQSTARPPPPPGFKLDAGGIPAPPKGFTLDQSQPSFLHRVVSGIESIPGTIVRTASSMLHQSATDQVRYEDITRRKLASQPVSAADRAWADQHVVSIAGGMAGGQDIGVGPISEAIGAVAPKAAEVAGAAKTVTEGPQAVSGAEAPANPPARPETSARASPGAVAEEGPLSRPAALTKPRAFENQLSQLRGLETNDQLDALSAVQKLPEDYTPALDEKLNHHEENPSGVPLSTREQAIYDEHVRPIRDEANALSKDLSRITGVTPDTNDIYTPRYVAGRTRSYGEAIAQWMKGVEVRFGGAAARTMRKTVDAQKGRDFFIAEHPETGDRTLVYVAPDRQVYAFDGTPQIKPFGKLAGSTGPKTGAIVRSDSGNLRLAQATTKEIEAQAQTRYIKSVMANRLDNLAKLRSAVRNAKFIDDMKALPEFGDFFKPTDETAVPPVTDGRRWRRPNVPQFQNFYAGPKVADALDDFMRTSKDAEGINRAFQNIGRFMNGVMFLNPLPHERNILNWSLITRGLAGNIIHAPTTVRSLIRAFSEIHNGGPEYRAAIKAGLSLPYARIVANDLHPMLIKRLGAATTANPRLWNNIAVRWGYPSARAMLGRWATMPNRTMWASQDGATLQRLFALRARGIPLEQAIERTHKELPSYRVPGQVP